MEAIKKLFKLVFIAFGVLCGIVVIAAVSSRSPAPRRPDSVQPVVAAPAAIKPTGIRAAKLVSAYKSNEIAADKLYKGIRLRVAGTIQEIRKSAFGDPVVILKGDGFLATVHCTFPKNTSDDLGRLNKGDRYIVDGDGDGEIMGSVMLHRCTEPSLDEIERDNPELLK